MRRTKVVVRRTLNNSNGNGNFRRRSQSISKKAVELCNLCESDASVLVLSPTGRLVCFAGNGSLDDVLTEYMSFPEVGTGSPITARTHTPQDNAVPLVHTMWGYRRAKQIMARLAKMEELQEEVDNLTEELDEVNERLWNYEPLPEAITTIEEAESCEKHVEEAMKRIKQIKENLIEHNTRWRERHLRRDNGGDIVEMNSQVARTEVEDGPSDVQDWDWVLQDSTNHNKISKEQSPVAPIGPNGGNGIGKQSILAENNGGGGSSSNNNNNEANNKIPSPRYPCTEPLVMSAGAAIDMLPEMDIDWAAQNQQEETGPDSTGEAGEGAE